MIATLEQDRPIDRLKGLFAEKDVRKVKLVAFDVDGVARGKYVSLDKFWGAARDGLGFCDVIFGWDSSDTLYDNARYTGWHTGYPDILAKVDLTSFRLIPWEPDTAFFLVDFVKPDGSPLTIAPRQLLQKLAQDAARMGFLPKYSSEYEFFFFRETPQSLREKSYTNLTPLTPGMFGYSVVRASANAPLVHDILDKLAAFDVEIEGMHTETGPGVYECAIRYDTIVRAADKAALFKTAVKEVAARHGVIPTFMAKWNQNLPGCSGHIHQSLWDLGGKQNLFFDGGKPGGMSEIMRHFVGGQVKLMPELCALIGPTVNSYKRMVPGTWAPIAATWGVENRTTALRAIPGNSPSSIRVEYRLAAADMNPYIAMSAALASGLYGVENAVEPPAPCQGNAYEAKDAPPLPSSLGAAVELLKGSKEAKERLGEEFLDHYIRTREWEVRAYEKAVSRWELERYFEII